MARRQFNVFNLSFLDVMSCGFGAVILFFMIISTQSKTRSELATNEIMAESRLIEEKILDEQKNLIVLKNTLDKKNDDNAIIKGNIDDLIKKIENLMKEIAFLENNSLASSEDIAKLQFDIEQLKKDVARLTSTAERKSNNPGDSYRRFDGDGDRQYLTELKLGGDHVLFLVDASTSMLGRTYVNVIRYRNMADEMKVKAPKWRQVVNSVDWLTTRLKPGTKFQIYAFNVDAKTIISDSDGDWIEVNDGTEIDAAIKDLKSVVPDKGTSLVNAFSQINQLSPRPDNIFLITDGLPTQAKRKPIREMISPDQRLKFFEQALRELPPVPVNVLLFPIDGDPFASAAYWSLAQRTRGSFMAPASDWP
jgi:hypothetical protein